MKVAGRVAIVTGGGAGIGEGVATALARHGARVCVAEIDAGRTRRVVDAIRAGGGDAIGVQTNVAETASVEALYERVRDAYGRVDILVNNAGIITDECPVTELTDDAWDRVMAVNLKGQFLCARAVARMMKTQSYGRIVNIASRAWLGSRHLAHYAASKGGVISLTRSLALELGAYGITVNDVCPNVTHGQRMGTIVEEKARVRGVTPHEIYEEYEGQTALGRFIEPSDVAAAVSFLVSDGARNITGHDIVVDAGWDV